MMKLRAPVSLVAGILAVLAAFGSLSAKPPSARQPDKQPGPPAPAQTPPGESGDGLTHWLLEQDGGSNAILLPLAQAIQAATGKRAIPFDVADAHDADFLKRLGVVMDRVLPRMNRPDSPAHAAAHLGELDDVAARFEDEIRSNMRTEGGSEAGTTPRGYPALRIDDEGSGKVFYLAVTLYPTGKRNEATRNGFAPQAFRFDPSQARRLITTDGCCLLVGIEHNGKAGNELAFLNWDVVDVNALPVRASIAFDANGGDVYHPGAVLTDGRRGTD